jgi:hypothetical protein
MHPALETVTPPVLPAALFTDPERYDLVTERNLLGKRIKRLEYMLGQAKPGSLEAEAILREGLDELREEYRHIEFALNFDGDLREIDLARRSNGRSCARCGHWLLDWAFCPTCDLPF